MTGVRVGEYRPSADRVDLGPIGGVSPISPLAITLALVAHAIELERQAEAAEAAALRALQGEAGRPREDRLSSMAKREHLNVADAKGRRHGRTYGPARGGWIPVHWADGTREMVRSDSLLIRFTVQSVGYVPKSERDRMAAEAQAEVA